MRKTLFHRRSANARRQARTHGADETEHRADNRGPRPPVPLRLALELRRADTRVSWIWMPLDLPREQATEALFTSVIIRTFQLVFSAGIVFFSHNKSVGTVIFGLFFLAMQTGPSGERREGEARAPASRERAVPPCRPATMRNATAPPQHCTS